MSEFIRVYESAYLFQVEIRKGRLAAEGIESYIKNTYVNNVAVMPINQYFILYVSHEDAADAIKVLQEVDRDLDI